LYQVNGLDEAWELERVGGTLQLEALSLFFHLNLLSEITKNLKLWSVNGLAVM
jgi:hypothetical protein